MARHLFLKCEILRSAFGNRNETSIGLKISGPIRRKEKSLIHRKRPFYNLRIPMKNLPSNNPNMFMNMLSSSLSCTYCISSKAAINMHLFIINFTSCSSSSSESMSLMVSSFSGLIMLMDITSSSSTPRVFSYGSGSS
jgi:hypothetical protein